MAVQKHELVVKKMLLDIFNNKIKAGTKLPTERQLSVDLGVDRTSLRVALKQMESMQILDIRQGDGIYVRDYRKHAGVDFLRALFFQQEEHGDEIIVDSYLIEEVWAFWAEFMPLMIRMALARITPMGIKAFMDIFDEELAHIDDRERMIQLEVQSQDLVAEHCGNLLMLLISNSTRQMRTKVVRVFVEMVDTDVLRGHVEFKRALLRGYQTGELRDPDIFSTEHKKLLNLHQGLIKKLWPITEKERTLVSKVLKPDTASSR